MYIHLLCKDCHSNHIPVVLTLQAGLQSLDTAALPESTAQESYLRTYTKNIYMPDIK